MYSTETRPQYQVINYDKHTAREYKVLKTAQRAFNACRHGELRQSGNVIFCGRQEWFLLGAK